MGKAECGGECNAGQILPAHGNHIKAVPHHTLPVPAHFVLMPSRSEMALNKTEKAFLRMLRGGKQRRLIWIQAVTLRLGDDCRYTPDFMTLNHRGRTIFWEVKGFFRDDAKVKLKVAAHEFPQVRFVVVTRNKLRFQFTRIYP
jgi:hypothetical protein